MDNIQAILFNKNKWTPSNALKWLKKHNHNPIKPVHITDNYLRYRLRQPHKDYSYITKDIGDGIKLIIITN